MTVSMDPEIVEELGVGDGASVADGDGEGDAVGAGEGETDVCDGVGVGVGVGDDNDLPAGSEGSPLNRTLFVSIGNWQAVIPTALRTAQVARQRRYRPILRNPHKI